MLAMLTYHLQTAATRTAQTAVLGLAAAFLLLIGLGFLTAAVWLLLATLTTPLITALILGGVYSGMGFLVLAVISMRSHARRREHAAALAAAAPASSNNLTSIIAAFMAGLTAGKKARF